MFSFRGGVVVSLGGEGTHIQVGCAGGIECCLFLRSFQSQTLGLLPFNPPLAGDFDNGKIMGPVLLCFAWEGVPFLKETTRETPGEHLGGSPADTHGQPPMFLPCLSRGQRGKGAQNKETHDHKDGLKIGIRSFAE